MQLDATAQAYLKMFESRVPQLGTKVASGWETTPDDLVSAGYRIANDTEKFYWERQDKGHHNKSPETWGTAEEAVAAARKHRDGTT